MRIQAEVCDQAIRFLPLSRKCIVNKVVANRQRVGHGCPPQPYGNILQKNRSRLLYVQQGSWGRGGVESESLRTEAWCLNRWRRAGVPFSAPSPQNHPRVNIMQDGDTKLSTRFV